MTPPRTAVRPFSLLGIRALPPDLLSASNAAVRFVSCTSSVWLTMRSALIPPRLTDVMRKLAALSLNQLRENEQQWGTDIRACQRDLVLARNRIGGRIQPGSTTRATTNPAR
jgi:hypothetical protein